MYINTDFQNAITLSSPRISFRMTSGSEIIDSFNDLISAELEFIADSFIGVIPSWKLKVLIAYDDIKPNYINTEFYVELGAYSSNNENIHWCPIGFFIVSEDGQKTDEIQKQVNLTLYDKISKFDVKYIPLDFPLTGKEIREEIAMRNGVVLDVNDSDLIFDYYLFNGINIGQGQNITDREVLRQYMELNMSMAFINRHGYLESRCIFNAVPISDGITKEDYSDFKLEKEFGPINSLIYSNTAVNDEESYQDIVVEDNNSIIENGKHHVRFKNNIFIDPFPLSEQESIINLLFNLILGFCYSPFDIEMFARPDFDPGDLFEIKNMEDSSFLVPITNMTLRYNGGLMGTLSTKKIPEVLSENFIPTVMDRLTNAEIRVNKVKGEITAVVESQDELEEKVGTLEFNYDEFVLSFSRNPIRTNMLVYVPTSVHVLGAESGVSNNIDWVDISGTEVIFMSDVEGHISYAFMNPNIRNMYGFEKDRDYTLSGDFKFETTPSTAYEAGWIFDIHVYDDLVSNSYIHDSYFIAQGSDTYLMNEFTFRLPNTAVGWYLTLRSEWYIPFQQPFQFTHLHMRDLQLEVGTERTSFVNETAKFGGARYVFDGDNASFYNGGLRIYKTSISGTTQVMGADINGDLWMNSLKINNGLEVSGGGVAFGGVSTGDYFEINNMPMQIIQADRDFLSMTRTGTYSTSWLMHLGYGHLHFGIDGSGITGAYLFTITTGGNVEIGGRQADTEPTHKLAVRGSGLFDDEVLISNSDYRRHLKLQRGSIEVQLNPSTGSNSGSSPELRFEGVNGYWFDGDIGFTGTLNNGTVPWARLSGVPSTFPPSTHTHSQYITTALPLARYDSNGSYASQFEGGALHASGGSSLSGYYIGYKVGSTWFRLRSGYADTAGGVAWGDVSSKPSTFTPSSHGHTLSAGRGLSNDGGSLSLRMLDIPAGTNAVGGLPMNGNTASAGRWHGSTTSPNASNRLNFNGVLYAYGIRWGPSGGSGYSDIRLKKDVGSLNYGKDLILSLKPKQFRFNEKTEIEAETKMSKMGETPSSRHALRDKLHYGFIAQEVVEIMDELGVKRPALIQEPHEEEEYYGMVYTELIPPMVQTIQYLNDEIEKLKGEIYGTKTKA